MIVALLVLPDELDLGTRQCPSDGNCRKDDDCSLFREVVGGLFGWALAGDINKNCYVNLEDFAMLANQWQKCNDPNAADFNESLFDDPNSIPSTCHGVWQAGMGLAADLNHDCRVDYSDLSAFAEDYLNCNNPDDSNCTPTW